MLRWIDHTDPVIRQVGGYKIGLEQAALRRSQIVSMIPVLAATPG